MSSRVNDVNGDNLQDPPQSKILATPMSGSEPRLLLSSCPLVNSFGSTRGNKYKLQKSASHYNLRKFSFCSRVVNIWNSLPDSVVDADTLILILSKSRLDKHWLDQDVLYNFHSELTGNGGVSICMWCCKRYGQRGIPAPVYSHWIG